MNWSTAKAAAIRPHVSWSPLETEGTTTKSGLSFHILLLVAELNKKHAGPLGIHTSNQHQKEEGKTPISSVAGRVNGFLKKFKSGLK